MGTRNAAARHDLCGVCGGGGKGGFEVRLRGWERGSGKGGLGWVCWVGSLGGFVRS